MRFLCILSYFVSQTDFLRNLSELADQETESVLTQFFRLDIILYTCTVTFILCIFFLGVSQTDFLRNLTELADQETDSMLTFIEQSRRELKMTGLEIQDEQIALKRTSQLMGELSFTNIYR